MGQEIIIALIQGGVTLSVGALTAFVTYRAVRLQIKKNEETFLKKREQQEKERTKVERESHDYQKQIIERFIDFEIHDNFNIIKRNYNRKLVFSTEKLREEEFDPTGLDFTEFDKIKYELIKYKSDTINEVIEIYDAFRLLMIYEGLCRKMPDDEFHKFKKGYEHCLNRFEKDLRQSLMYY
ncbi:hypothetical protein PWJ77_10055 [Bacillus sp. CNPSo 3703]|uniref:hypothetical protein n=1 Tax=Bacillus altitudinis TaxID=293387 RepID=UPI00237B27A7|nr:hypothetical protein [Bacillus altitudinis]MDE0640815.1 hypothetical protein [Bacillus altitudinis]